MRRSVSDLPCLDIAELKRRQLFKGEQAALVEVRSDVGEFLVQHRGHGQELEVQYRSDHGSGKEIVKCTDVDLNFGSRRFFNCPRSDARALKLYIDEGRLGSASALGLARYIRPKSPRAPEPDRWQDFRLAPSDSNSTESGYARSSVPEPRSSDYWDDLTEAHDVGRVSKPVRMKDVCGKTSYKTCPQVNAIALTELGLLPDDDCVFLLLKYMTEEPPRQTIDLVLFFDLREAGKERLRFTIKEPGVELRFGATDMVRSQDGWQFMCPIMNEPTYTLFLRDQMLGSHKGLGIRKSAVVSGRRG